MSLHGWCGTSGLTFCEKVSKKSLIPAHGIEMGIEMGNIVVCNCHFMGGIPLPNRGEVGRNNYFAWFFYMCSLVRERSINHFLNWKINLGNGFDQSCWLPVQQNWILSIKLGELKTYLIFLEQVEVVKLATLSNANSLYLIRIANDSAKMLCKTGLRKIAKKSTLLNPPFSQRYCVTASLSIKTFRTRIGRL